MNEIVDKSSHFKQVCQLLVSLIVAIVHPRLRKPREIQRMLTILMNKSNNFDQQQHSKSLLLSSHQGYLQGLQLSPPSAVKLYQWMEKLCVFFLKSSGSLKNHLLTKKNRYQQAVLVNADVWNNPISQ